MSVMSQMGFGDKWIFWIIGCLSSSRASVLINDHSTTKELPITRGIHQGDPLSPFLFIIAMEGLNVAMRLACQNSIFHGVKVPNSDLDISHLFYADDALFVRQWASSNFANLARILRCFHATLGLKVNFHKSMVYGIDVSDLEVGCAQIFGCEVASLLFKYLGVPVGANMRLKRNWQPIIERVQNRLSSWKAKNLSFGGRLTLVKSVLGNGEFAYRFPLLFELDKKKSCLASDRCNPHNMDWAWKKLPSSPLEFSELESLKEIIESYSFFVGSDS
uniref:Reverse transcriptase domain-containing protein n=1 Tax=Lactuca sativa TaxID=4236 RepID=A0A9R1W037_LACSA|nr:hypothetical protein LSAT_V11C400197820 [Lactuca sativa]